MLILSGKSWGNYYEKFSQKDKKESTPWMLIENFMVYISFIIHKNFFCKDIEICKAKFLEISPQIWICQI